MTYNCTQLYTIYQLIVFSRIVHYNMKLSHTSSQSASNKKLLELGITLMDGTTHKIIVDPNTTSRDLSLRLAETINLKDRFGFSIYIAIYDKVWN